MKKFSVLLIAIILFSSMVFTVFALETVEEKIEEDERPEKVEIEKLFFRGKGLGINQSDKTDVAYVRAVGAQIVLPNGNILARGRLRVDREPYRLINIEVTEFTATAEIIDKDSDPESAEAIGSIELERIEKEGKDLWIGSMNLNDKTYDLYLLGFGRKFTVREVARKAWRFCKNNPENEHCKSVAGINCRDNPRECRLKVWRFCKTHPRDNRCKQFLKSACTDVIDKRCRHAKGLKVEAIQIAEEVEP